LLLLLSLPGDRASLRSLPAGDLLRLLLTGDLERRLSPRGGASLDGLLSLLACDGDLAGGRGGGGSGLLRLAFLRGDLDLLYRPGDLDLAIFLYPCKEQASMCCSVPFVQLLIQWSIERPYTVYTPQPPDTNLREKWM